MKRKKQNIFQKHGFKWILNENQAVVAFFILL